MIHQLAGREYLLKISGIRESITFIGFQDTEVVV